MFASVFGEIWSFFWSTDFTVMGMILTDREHLSNSFLFLAEIVLYCVTYIN